MEIDVPIQTEQAAVIQPSPLSPHSRSSAPLLQSDDPGVNQAADRDPSFPPDVTHGLQSLALSAGPPSDGPLVARVEEKFS